MNHAHLRGASRCPQRGLLFARENLELIEAPIDALMWMRRTGELKMEDEKLYRLRGGIALDGTAFKPVLMPSDK